MGVTLRVFDMLACSRVRVLLGKAKVNHVNAIA